MPAPFINADDFGIAPQVNRAIAAAHAHGTLAGASLMVGMRGTDQAIEIARSAPRLCVGLHLRLTSGRPVAAPSKLPALVDGDGRFRHSFLSLWRLLRSRQRSEALRQVAVEWEAQLCEYRRCGLPLHHVDSHQHVHMLPQLFPVAEALSREDGAMLRVAVEPHADGSWRVGNSSLSVRWKGWLRRSLLARCATSKAVATFRRPYRRCAGIFHSGQMTRDVLSFWLRAAAMEDLEIITHPALPSTEPLDPDLSEEDRGFLGAAEREAEFAALLDPSFHSADVLKPQEGVDQVRVY